MALQVLHVRQPFPRVLFRGKHSVSCWAIKKLNLFKADHPDQKDRPG